jgi:transposase
VGQHSSGSGSALLGLDGFQVVSAELVSGEWQLPVQTTATVIGCGGCGVRATPHGRRTVRVRDLPIGGRPVALSGAGLRGTDLDRASGRDRSSGGADRAGPGRGLPAGRQGRPCGRGGRPRPGVGWATIMRAVVDHGTPLVDDPRAWTVWPGLAWTRPASSRPPGSRPLGG